MGIKKKPLLLEEQLPDALEPFQVELAQVLSNAKQEVKQVYQYVKKQPLVCLILLTVLIIALCSLIILPHWQVSHYNITDQKDLANVENSFRVTLAQMFGGIAIGIGLYYTWRRVTISEEDLKATKEGQITERFTRAVDQLGNPAIEIRLGGIYALERISNESDKDYWPIMEILTSYIRKNSNFEAFEVNKFEDILMDTLAPIEVKTQKIKELSFDIRAIITVITRRKYSYNNGKNKNLDLSRANLEGANLYEANLQGTNLEWANLEGANLSRVNLLRLTSLGLTLKGLTLKGLKT